MCAAVRGTHRDAVFTVSPNSFQRGSSRRPRIVSTTVPESMPIWRRTCEVQRTISHEIHAKYETCQ